MDIPLQACLYGVAAVAGLYALWQFMRLHGSRRWHATEGLVLGASSGRTPHGDGAGFHDTVVTAIIEYRYKVDGLHYQGRRVSLTGDVFTDRETRAHRIASRYRAGERVRVWYKPCDPADCCLERTAEGAWFTLGTAALFAALSYVLF